MKPAILTLTAATLFTLASIPANASNSSLTEHIQGEIAAANGIHNYDRHAHPSRKHALSSRRKAIKAYSLPGNSSAFSPVDSRAIERWQSRHAGEGGALNYSD
jgi:hypothetical protein